jgi:surface protein
VPPKVSANSEVQWTPKKFKNSSYIVMTFMRDIGYPDFFEYENIDNCFKNDDYNFHFYYSCYIKKDDIIEFTFKKELKNLDSFLSNNRSRQVEYLFSIDLSNMIPIVKDVTSMNFMFKGCKNLKYINFGNFDASKVTSMISMFEGCTSLISLNLSNFDTSNVIHMSGIFNNLISLKILDISNFNMEKVINYNDMFCNLTELRYINIYNYKNDKNKTICNTFKNNENLIVCQNEKIISNPNFIYKCCNFDIENDN